MLRLGKPEYPKKAIMPYQVNRQAFLTLRSPELDSTGEGEEEREAL